MEIRGSVALVTGASSGIGEAIARALAAQGAEVVLAARREDVLTRLAGEIERAGGHALAVPTDMTQRPAIERLVGLTIEHFGRLDIVVNNAGIGGGSSILDDPDAQMEQIVNVNLLAPARLVQAALPYLRQGGGVVVNIGSVAGDVAVGGLYSATKFGLRGLSDALRRELHVDGIAVVHIAPGFIRTAMTAGMSVPMPGPEVVARAVVAAIRTPRRRVTVPWPYVIPATIARAFPAVADRLLGSPAVQRRYHDRESTQGRG